MIRLASTVCDEVVCLHDQLVTSIVVFRHTAWVIRHSGKPKESAASQLNNQTVLKTYFLYFIQFFLCFVPFH